MVTMVNMPIMAKEVTVVNSKGPLDMEDVMTVTEIANKLKVSVNTVGRWCAEGRFPHAYKAGRPWRVPRTDVETYLLALTENRLKEA